MPPPRMVTERPLPTFAGQSPGRGEINAEGGGGGGGAGGLVTTPGAADEDPQLAVEAPIITNFYWANATMRHDCR